MNLVSQYPEIIAVVIVVVGFVAAYLASRWSLLGVAFVARSYRKLSPDREALAPGSERLVARTVYYLTLGFFLLLALRSLGIMVVADWLDTLIAYIPRILLGGVIIFGGYLLGLLARSLVASLISPESNQLLPTISQYLVVVVAIVTGLEQMAIELSFLATLTVVILGALLGSLSLAFALGSKDMVANLLSRRELDRFLVGDFIAVDGLEGQIIELTRTSVILASKEGNIIVPASKLVNSVVLHRSALS